MKRFAALAMLAALPAAASVSLTVGLGSNVSIAGLFDYKWKCVHSNGAACSASDLRNAYYKQVVILPSGFTDADKSTFFSAFDTTVSLMANAGNAWSAQRAGQILYVGYFVGGGELGTPAATFGGKVATHPVRGYALSLSQSAVYAQIDAIRASDIPSLRPFGAAVLFNTFQNPVTANAAPPSLVNKPFGVAKFTRYDLRDAYVPSHELAHASLNFLDEYVEPGFQDLSMKQIDVATPLVLFDGTWGGFVKAISNLFSVYDYNLSEILSHNGNDNMATTSWPTTVGTPGFSAQNYQYEGGMFFGRGTWHQRGNNLMNDNDVMRGPDDGFAYAHSASQQQVINNAFDGGIPRPNDRLRNAGPRNGWPLAFGQTTNVMLFDADKNHHFHPTQSYSVQVGWYERHWKTCWAGFIPYPCSDDVWTTAQTQVYPAYRTLSLKLSSAYGLAKLAQKLVCAAGVNEISSGGGTIRLCDQNLDTMADNFLPTVTFPVPYQNVAVPASQWFTTYWWRFSTYNGRAQSGYTGWSSFYRSF